MRSGGFSISRAHALQLAMLGLVGAYLVWLGWRDVQSRRSLVDYVRRGDGAALARATRAASKSALNAGDDRGRTALHWALALGRTDLAVLLLEAGADPNAMDTANFSPLHVAVDRVDMAGLDALLTHGANPNARERMGISAFDLSLRRLPAELRGNRQALEYGVRAANDPAPPGSPAHLNLVRRLLEAGADPNGPFLPSGISPLNEASESLPVDFVGLLLDFKADARRSDRSGRNVVQIAVRRNRIDLFEYLRARGVAPNQTGSDGATALHTAAEMLAPDWVARLLALGADCNAKDKSGESAFYAGFRTLRGRLTDGATQEAADERDLRWFAVCKLLLKAGLDVRNGDANGITPLHLLVEHPACPIELVDAMLQRGADVNARDRYGESPAMHARNGQLLPRLLARGADLDLESQLGFSVYRRASYRGDWSQFDYLLSASRRVWTDQSFRTRRLLDLLSNERCPIDVADRLLAAGVAVTLTTDGWTRHTALHLAARSGRLDLVLRLLQAGARPDARDAVGKTPLHHAAERAIELGIIQALALAGADLNLMDAYGRTPMHCVLEAAAESLNFERRPAHCEALKMLIELGADVQLGPASDRAGPNAIRPFLSPLELAIARELPDATAILLAGGADPNVAHPETGATATHLAAMQPAEHMRMLLAAGANPNARDRRARTPLHFAVARCSDPETILELRRHGAAVDLLDADGFRPMDIATGKVERNAYFDLHHRFEITQRRGQSLRSNAAEVRAALAAPAARASAIEAAGGR